MNRDFFKEPSGKPEYGMGCFWFWNDRIEEAEMLRQQKLMKENAVSMPLIHSRFGREIDYLGETWMERVRASVRFAKENGQKVWLYDEDNWPSGTCSKSVTREERFREHFLRMREVEGKDWASFCREIEPRKFLEVCLEKGGCLWTADQEPAELIVEKDQKLTVIYWDVRPYEQGGRSCVDYLNPEAIALFMEKTHEAYRKALGEELLASVIGFFMDETRFYYCYPWTERFAEEFRIRKGYDILVHLHELFGEGERTQAELDYMDVAAALYKEATFWQVYEWCEKYGLLSTAHLLGEETLATQSRFEMDLMRHYEAMHVPGIDHLGRGIGSLDAKFAVSAARNYGKDRVCCEAFGAAGWDTGIEDVIRVSNWLISQGVNLLAVHGYYYSTRDERKNDFPPSYFFQWKDWDKAGTYNRMAARMMELASGGRPYEDILVYYPIETFWKHYRPDPLEGTGFGENSRRIKSERAAQIDREYQIFLNGLFDRNIPFRIFNGDSAKNYEIRDGKWTNRLNGETFSTFVLVDVEILPEKVEGLLKTFAKEGGTILAYGSKPLRDAGGVSFGSLQDLTDRCEACSDMGLEILEGTRECQHNLPAYPDHLIDPYIHNGEDLYGMSISRYDKDGYRIYNFTNYNVRAERMTVKLDGVELAELWNPENGKIEEAELVRRDETEGSGCVKFEVPPNRTRYIVCR